MSLPRTGGKPNIVATSSVLGDLVRNVAGNQPEVKLCWTLLQHRGRAMPGPDRVRSIALEGRVTGLAAHEFGE
ncbi:MAG TPA: hypothetical protein VH575_16115, partial [Gemmataceae bacterium]